MTKQVKKVERVVGGVALLVLALSAAIVACVQFNNPVLLMILGIANLAAVTALLLSMQRYVKVCLEYQALNDPITGLRNRRAYDDFLESEMARIDRYGGDLALLVITIDNFKQVNDRFGREVGDKMLKAVAECAQVTCRDTDRACRIGNDAFAIIAVNTGLEGVKVFASHMRKALGAIALPAMKQVVVSMGCAAYVSPEASHSLLRRAEDDLYQSRIASTK